MLSGLEIVVVIVVVGGLLLLQMKTRTGSLLPYLAVGILLLMLIVATRIIRSLIGVAIILVLLCAVLLWRVVRSRHNLPQRPVSFRIEVTPDSDVEANQESSSEQSNGRKDDCHVQSLCGH